MYKVNLEDEIARFRTQQGAHELDKAQGGLAGALEKDKKRAKQLHKRFMKIVTSLTHETAFEAVRLAHKMSDLAHGSSAKHSVCQKGCSHCCAVNVSVSAIEVAYIEAKTGVLAHAQPKPYDVKPTDKNITYCPFLNKDTSTCSIYAYRPIVCRSFFTFDDPKFCVDSSTSHMIISMNQVNATKHLYDVLLECSDNKQYDIRQFWQ